ncbi:ATPase AFG2 protein [Achlya hypogyna]|uniref:ATPase AFG2 protein n=1 Tax=Achlya hypogyna TaxID=1202772 RepID=A0A1V9ZAU9_ACHHY|nr:ATPase AFG2 protein [Achlya hypogyna]
MAKNKKSKAAGTTPTANQQTAAAAVETPPPTRFFKLEVGRSALGSTDPRSVQIITRINMHLTDMKAHGFATGDSIVVCAAGDDSGAMGLVLLSGTVWPSEKTKRGMVVVGSVWKEVVEQLGASNVEVCGLYSHPHAVRAVAESVTLQALPNAQGMFAPLSEKEQALLTHYVRSMLLGALLLERAIVVLSVHGTSRRFQVTQCVAATATGNVFLVRANTTAIVHWGEAPACAPTPTHLDASFEAIGGLQTQIDAVRQLVEQPLVNPGLFARFGLPPPKGVLLFGPPGTGKTMIARAVAAAASAKVFTINGPELVSKFVGESEANVRAVFRAAAAQSPALVFIDEIDALCPKRDATVGDMERRVVATLLTCMDGLDAAPGVVVLAATNRPNALDPALRRPGRLDREIEIPIPSAADRLRILQKTLRPMPHAVGDTELEAIAGQAHGYVGADLSALCKEAALLALRRSLAHVQVTAGDLRVAMSKIRPSALREITLDVPRVLWSEIGGQGGIKQQLKEAVEWPLTHPEAFVRMGIRPPKGILLYGPPGCSKTLTAKALATEGGMNFIAIKGPELFSKWVGESEKAIQAIFAKARAAAPSVVFFDEIDAVAGARSGSSSSGVGDRVLSQLLNELDGIEPLKKVIIVAATNRPDLLDAALMRPGRIDRVLYVGPPDAAARQEILGIHTRKMPLAPDVDLAALALATDRFSGAELAAFCREAALAAIQEDTSTTAVAARHFAAAQKMITPQIDDRMLTFFQQYRDSHRGA